MTSQAAHEISTPDLRHQIHGAFDENTSWGYTTHSPVSNHLVLSAHPTSSIGPSAQRVLSPHIGRCYDRPGKKPAADFERDPIRLYDKICRGRGRSNFATDWTLVAFKFGITEGELRRVLTPQEISAIDFTGGFDLQHVYEGFITKVGDYYECGLCKEGKETYWKAKKDAPRHLRKFHFGLADVCKAWYVPPMLYLS